MILSKVKLPNGGGFTYDYDKRGNVKTVTTESGTATTYTYDGLDRVIREKSVDKDVKYEYNEYGRLSCVKHFDNVVKSFGYRGDRLVSVTSEDVTESRSYDAYGNPVKIGNKTLQWTRGTLLKSAGSTEYGYDYRGLRVSKNGTKFYYEGGAILTI